MDVILRADDMNTSSTDSPWNIGASLTGYIESNHNVSQLQAIRAALSRKPIALNSGKTQTILGLLTAVLHATPARRHDRFCNFALASPWMTGNNIRDISMPVNGDDVTGNELKPDIVIGSCKYRVRVLACAPSNSSLDEIVLRVLHQGVRDENGCTYSPKIVRIGRTQKSWNGRAETGSICEGHG